MTAAYNLTDKEFAAAKIFVQACLDNVGGKRPADLEDDECTWVDLEDLTRKGYSRFEAAGLMSALSAKGFMVEHDPGDWCVETSGWQWMDKHWN